MPTRFAAGSWTHSHAFSDGNALAELNTFWVVVLTAVTMVVEIAGGWWFNSMALLDVEMNAPASEEICDVIKASPVPATISDLRVWRVGKGMYACIVSLVTSGDADP